MAGDLPFLDSFDHYNTAHSYEKWGSGVGVVVAGGRRGTAGAAISGLGPISKTFDGEYTTLYVGGAFNGAYNNSPLVLSNALTGISVEMHAVGDGRFVMKANGVTGSAVTIPILDNRWYYLEMKAVVTLSAITVEFRINEHVVLNDSYSFPVAFVGGTLHVAWSTLTLYGRSFGVNTALDDVYADDAEYFGDINIDVIHPNGVGGSAAWTAVPAGNNWDNTKEHIPDDDTTIVSSIAIGDIDTYAMEDIPAGLEPVAIQGLISAKKSTAGLAAYKLQYTSSGGTVLSGEFYPSESDYWYARDGRKNVGGALNSALVNSIVFGPKRTQ